MKKRTKLAKVSQAIALKHISGCFYHLFEINNAFNISIRCCSTFCFTAVLLTAKNRSIDHGKRIKFSPRMSVLLF